MRLRDVLSEEELEDIVDAIHGLDPDGSPSRLLPDENQRQLRFASRRQRIFASHRALAVERDRLAAELYSLQRQTAIRDTVQDAARCELAEAKAEGERLAAENADLRRRLEYARATVQAKVQYWDDESDKVRELAGWRYYVENAPRIDGLMREAFPDTLPEKNL